jgi:SAM-dependent methyltransferase
LQQWIRQLADAPSLCRKVWEWCFICQALAERGMLAPGRRGLGFAVGREPLSALFATYGCDVVATDLSASEAGLAGWAASGQHATNLEALNERGICPSDVLRQRVQFRTVDMNHIPDDLRGFDFAWSSCAFEHLGSLRRGEQFIRRMTRCLKPGGVAVHTTEFNVLSNTHTIESGHTVAYRRQDLEAMARWLAHRGHRVELDFHLGDAAEDWQLDRPPYGRMPHLKLQLGEYICTSYALIIEIGRRRPLWQRVRGRLARLNPLRPRAA